MLPLMMMTMMLLTFDMCVPDIAVLSCYFVVVVADTVNVVGIAAAAASVAHPSKWKHF